MAGARPVQGVRAQSTLATQRQWVSRPLYALRTQRASVLWPLSTDVNLVKNLNRGASLVAQWLRIHLPMQGTWVRALVWEDPTCHGATKPVRHNY